MKNSLKLFSLFLLIGCFSLQAQEEKTNFFKFNLEITGGTSLDLSGLSEYYSQDQTIEGVKEDDGNKINIYPTIYKVSSESKSDPKFSLEYWRLDKDLDFSQSWKEYNFLIGVSQNDYKVNTKSFFFQSKTLNDFIVEGITFSTKFLGFGRGGKFETKNQDAYIGMPFYLKDYKDLLFVPKLMKRNHKWTLNNTVIGFSLGDSPGSSLEISSFTADAEMSYSGFALEKGWNEKYYFVVDYFTSGKSKGSYTLSRFSSSKTTTEEKSISSFYSLKELDWSLGIIDFTKGSYNVSGTKAVLGFKYKYKPNLDFYLTNVQEIFETSFSPLFNLYNVSVSLGSIKGTVDEVDSQELLTDFIIWNTKKKIKIGDYHLGVSYKF